MTPDELAALRSQLTAHEGRRSRPYTDTVGKLTIGVGRNLTDKGLSDGEIDVLLTNDIAECASDLALTYDWFIGMSQPRQFALIDMRFNLGKAGLAGFQKFLHALAVKNYEEAAREMLASRWAQQVGKRTDDLAKMMRDG